MAATTTTASVGRSALGWVLGIFLMLIVLFIVFEIFIQPFGALLSVTTNWSMALHVGVWIFIFLLTLFLTKPLGAAVGSMFKRIVHPHRPFAIISVALFLALLGFWIYAMFLSAVDFDWEALPYSTFNRVISVLLVLNFVKIALNIFPSSETS